MADRVALALHAFDQLRSGKVYRTLPPAERSALDEHIGRIARTLRGGARYGAPVAAPAARSLAADPYARLLGTPDDLQRQFDGGSAGGPGASSSPPPAPPAVPPSPPPPPSTSQIGQRAEAALDAIDFPGFVASLVTGTFQAVVDASKQQISSYAELVSSLSQTVEDFSAEKVTPNQTRDWLRDRHPQDLQVVLPAPGKVEQPQLLPRPEREGQSPAWLDEYGLSGQPLSAEVTDGPLIDAGRLKVAEERMQTLATLVLMGINRVVVSDGDIRARLQFHASARDTTKADIEQQQLAIASQPVQAAQATTMMVSTLKVNAQADASIKADLMGEVHITFRSETFPLERFADSPAIQLINRHARWQKAPAAAGAAAASPTSEASGASPAPEPAPSPEPPPPESAGSASPARPGPGASPVRSPGPRGIA